MKCIHLGPQKGEIIKACCNGGEQRLPLMECHVRAEGFTLETLSDKSMMTVEFDGHREMRTIAGCQGCSLFEGDRTLPDFTPAVPRGRAAMAWEEMRRKRAHVQPVNEPLRECFRTHVPTEIPPESVIHTRHLLYHIWPKTGSNWQVQLAGIERRLPLFNGRKIVSIAEDDESDKIDIPWADKVIRHRNDPNLGEVVSFVQKLEEVSGMGPNEAAFYCHGKGVRHPVTNTTTVHLWSDIMLEVLLDHWPYINGLLAAYPIVGAFKKLGQSLAPTTARWHFTGTFWWLRNDVFSRDWRKVDPKYWGTESWPGVHFKEEEGGCAFLAGSPALLNLYDMHFVLTQVVPRLELFRSLMEKYRT